MTRDFKGVWIPREIWLDERLNIAEKALLAEIDSIDTGGGANVTNAYLAEFSRADERTIQRYLAHLLVLGVIEITSIRGVRRIKRKIEGSAPDETKAKTRTFQPPTVDEVRAYCEERKNNVDPEAFVDFYTSQGWRVGKTTMKDWHAAVRTWEHRRSGDKKNDGTLKHEYTKEQLYSVVKRGSDIGDMPWDVDEIAEYAAKEGFDVDAQAVWDYYGPTMWQGVKDWRQAVKEYAGVKNG